MSLTSSYTAGMEDELDDVSGGRAAWKEVLAAFCARLQAEVR